MPVAKLLASSTPDAMKAEEGNDLDTILKQAVAKEPHFSFTRSGDHPVQWIQLLHALDQQADVPGWPLLTPLKVPMQKCDKCAREFCSPINYRRHIRVHRRSLNIDKESHKRRDLLGAFWDKLTVDEVKEVMSFEDVALEEVPGSSIIRAITANIRKPGFLGLPQAYVKAGSVLVDIIQGEPSRLPVTSQELFSVLDDASERTFLCAGTAESMQKYVFDGDAGKIGLDSKNLIACTSFLAEQRLVKAWLAEKDAEALRCQKLLVEEEEAAQKRQAELLERKRQKKLRQKEQRAKDSNVEKIDLNGTIDMYESSLSTETSSPPASSEADTYAFESAINHITTLLEDVEFLNDEQNMDIEAQGGCSSEHSDSGASHNVEPQNVQGNGYKPLVVTRWQVPKSQKGGRNGFHASNNSVHLLKREPVQKHGPPHRDQRAVPNNGSKVWTKKPKPDNGGDFPRNSVHNDATNQTDQANCQLMIGSISVTVRTSSAQNQVAHVAHAETQDSGMELKKSSVQWGSNRSTAKLWRPRQEARGQLLDRSDNQVCEDDISEKFADCAMHSDSCPSSLEIKGNCSEGTNEFHQLAENAAQSEGLLFSSDAAKAFLTQRWKEAISGDHVKLIISSENESPCNADTCDHSRASESQGRSILGSAENRLANVGTLESSTNGNGKAKYRRKPEKGGVKRKYIPKQKTC